MKQRYPRASGASGNLARKPRLVPAVYMDASGNDYQCGICPRCKRNDAHAFRVYNGWAFCPCGFYEGSPRWRLDY